MRSRRLKSDGKSRVEYHLKENLYKVGGLKRLTQQALLWQSELMKPLLFADYRRQQAQV